MRSVGSREWGADKKTMKMLYIWLIRSTLDYGCIAYGSASKIHLDKIEIIQSAALRMCCRACKTTPIPALQAEMGELPIDLRRLQIRTVTVNKNYRTDIRGRSREVKDNRQTFVQL